jgi:hypothetical protein
MQNPPRLDRLCEPIRAADSPISGKCSLHFPDIGGANPKEQRAALAKARAVVSAPPGAFFMKNAG